MESPPPREAEAPAPIVWRSPLEREHPLVGQIWDVRGEAPIGRDELEAALAGARYVLLGEKHDNEDHHLLQAALIKGLAAAGRRPAVAFEMIDDDRQGALDELGTPESADQVAAAVDWEAQWGHFDLYRPIIEAALSAELPIRGGNFPIASTRALVRQGLPAIGVELASRLGLDQPQAPALEAALIEELRGAHCGHPMPEAMLSGMALAQRARDAMMAERLREGATPQGGGVLIAGAGHVRLDRGVPLRLAQLEPGAQIAALAFIEVASGSEEPLAYAARYGVERLPFHYVWFTPVANDDDPCAAFRRR